MTPMDFLSRSNSRVAILCSDSAHAWQQPLQNKYKSTGSKFIQLKGYIYKTTKLDIRNRAFNLLT